MITEVYIENFRGFERHRIPFSTLTILVGRNNAGKSTVVEALRLVSLILARARTRGVRFVGPPGWLDAESRASWGPAPATPRDLDFHPQAFFHRYGEAPAIVTATFLNGTRVSAFVGPEGQLHGTIRDDDDQPAMSAADARLLGLTDVRVQPQVAPLPRNDTVLAPQTIERGLGTSLSPLHFRNQLNLAYRDNFASFKELAEATWPHLQIIELVGQGEPRETPLSLLVREGDFAAEVGLMGHGLQMWLQMIWFLAQSPPGASVVLDEPDVYMHPDLQHRLLAYIEKRYAQVTVTTHSVEIMSTVDPGSIVVVDRDATRSEPATSFPGVQDAIAEVGGVYNIDVARLFAATRFLVVEGDDIGLLAAFQDAARPKSTSSVTALPKYETGGWGGWSRATAGRLPRKNGQGQPIARFAIFDSDYRTAEEIVERYSEAKANKVAMHVWQRKEIENYVLEPTVIGRLIRERTSDDAGPSDEEVERKLDEIVSELWGGTREAVADHLQRLDKKLTVSGALRKADAQLKVQGATAEARRELVSGKRVVSLLSKWSSDEYGVSFGPITLAKGFDADDVPAEMATVLRSIEEGRAFPAASAHPATRLSAT